MIYALYFITVAVLVAYLFRLFAERDFWQDEFHGLSAAYVAEVKELEERVAELHSDGMELKQHCDGVERDLELWTEQSLTYQKESMALQKTVKQLEADCTDLFNRNCGLHGAVIDLRAVVEPILRNIESLEE